MPNTTTSGKTTDFLRASLEDTKPMAEQQVETEFPLMHFIKQSGNVETEDASGKLIERTIIRRNIGTFDMTDQRGENTSIQPDILDYGRWEWKYWGMGFDVPQHMLDLNQGKTKIVDLMSTYKKQATIELNGNLQTNILADGRVGSYSYPSFDGLKSIFQDGNPSAGTVYTQPTTQAIMLDAVAGASTYAGNTYGGIDRATDTEWRTQVDAGPSDTIVQVSISDLIKAQMTASNDALVDAPNIALCSPALWHWLNAQRTISGTQVRILDKNDNLLAGYNGRLTGLEIGTTLDA